MTVFPDNPADTPTPEALRAFLARCRQAAAQDGRARLVSISVAVDALDPLAVLETIYEPGERHFYTEQPARQVAIAGAEAVLAHNATGPGRFAEIQRFMDDALDRAIVIGPPGIPFSGPHFFAAFTFSDEVPDGAPFPAASVFVPRWQVAASGAATTAVANLLVAPDADIDALAERTWRAHRKFTCFDYAAPRPPRPPGRQPAVLNDPGAEAAYAGAVRAATADIAAGRYRKIVLARQLVVAGGDLHPLRLLNKLRERHPACHAFSVAGAGGRAFIGASPERLAAVRDGRLETEALAGSIRRGDGAGEDAALAVRLLRDPKNLAEHRLVLDAIGDALAPLGIRAEHPAAPVLRRLANVQHLCTPVTAEIPKGVRLLEILERLHPTPAVGGLPREAAVPRIRELEGFDRHLYAGALGWLDAWGGGEFFVGIRGALVGGGGPAVLHAGAGIVAGSEPAAELAETALKFRALLDSLAGE